VTLFGCGSGGARGVPDRVPHTEDSDRSFSRALGGAPIIIAESSLRYPLMAVSARLQANHSAFSMSRLRHTFTSDEPPRSSPPVKESLVPSSALFVVLPPNHGHLAFVPQFSMLLGPNERLPPLILNPYPLTHAPQIPSLLLLPNGGVSGQRILSVFEMPAQCSGFRCGLRPG